MKYLEKWTELYYKNKILIFVIFVQTVLIALLLMTVITLAVDRSVTIAFPPTGKEITAGSSSYKQLWGRYYIDLLMNFTPSDINNRLNILSTFVRDPDVLKKLTQQAQDIKKNNVSQTFVPYEGTWQVKGNIVSVKGHLQRWIGTTLIRSNDVLVKVELAPSASGVELEDWKSEKL